MFLRNQSIRLRFQNLDKLCTFINRMNKSEMNLEDTDQIVDRMDPNYLWHSNNALREELSRTKKELAKAQKKVKDLHWYKN